MLQAIGISFIFVGLLLILVNSATKIQRETPAKRKSPKKICVLIPAKYEVRVLENILLDLKNQDTRIDKDIFVILENDDEESFKICKKHRIKYIKRVNPELKTKGYALAEAFDYLEKNQKTYDLYFIFDADNRLEKNFLSEMIKSYEAGYDISTGYRKSTNINENKISVCSALTFSMINTLMNLPKLQRGKTITLSGTGYFVTREIIEEWGGFPFSSLTEDIEITIHSSIKNYNMDYVQTAIFYDEQPTKMSISLKQRSRWVKGYFINKIKNIKQMLAHANPNTISELIGVWPYVFFVTGAILIIIASLIDLAHGEDVAALIIGELFLIYLIMAVVTISMLLKDGRKLGVNSKTAFRAVLFNPIFLSTYIICIIMAIFAPVSWEKIEHYGNKKSPHQG